MKTLVCVPVYNRFAVARSCILQLIAGCQGDCFVQVIDDGSTEPNATQFFNELYLTEPYGEVVRQKHLGIDQTRANQIRFFWENPEYDYLYLTDADAYHDFNWYQTALDLLSQHNLPISLYRSDTDIHPCDHLGLGQHAPGISMFLTRSNVEPLIACLHQIATVNWDWQVCRMLDRWIFPQQSYVQHYGAGGLNNKTMEQDRAENPTEFLIESDAWVMREIDETRQELVAMQGVVGSDTNAIDPVFLK